MTGTVSQAEFQALRERVHGLEVSYAAQMATVRTTLEDVAHDVKNVLQKLDGFVHRREIMEKFAEVKETNAGTMRGISIRVTSLERNQTWAVRAIAGAWLAGGCVVGFGKRLFT